MRYKFIISLLMVQVLFAKAMAQPAPRVSQVIHKFYSTYNLSAFVSQYVEFQKKRNDWYIVTIDYSGSGVIRNQPFLFYSGEKKKFLELAIDRNGTERKVNITDYMDDYTIASFDLQPYYGYAGWYNDVIAYLEKKNSLTDDELYALGRAYAAKAIALTTNTGRDAMPGEQLVLPFDINALNGEQLAAYTAIEDSAISKLRQLAEKNARYATIVGSSRQKYANEVMAKYHTLLTFADTIAAQLSLPKALYAKDSLLLQARKWLTDCPPGAVFLSFGDNDFYPLLYLQLTEGLRRDVYVINYNLLAVDRFIFRLGYAQLEAAAIKMSADTTLYAGETNDYQLLRHSARQVHLPDLIDFLREQAIKNTNAPAVLEAGWLSLGKRKGLSDPGHIPISSNRYLLKNHWVLFDILGNLGDRRLCMPHGLFDEMKILNNLFVQEGSVRIYDN